MPSMTSIPHFEDLSVSDIYDALDLKWMASEKLDGTSLEAGLDEAGLFYTKRKGGEPVYDVDDWPEEIWAGTYRRAHASVSCFVEALVKENAISNGDVIGFEVLEGHYPNSVSYIPPSGAGAVHGFVVITHTSWTPNTAFYSIAFTMLTSSHAITSYTMDGRSVGSQLENFKHQFKVNSAIGTDWIQARLRPSAEQTRMVMDTWLPAPSSISGFTNREVLEANLARKHPNAGDRNWNDLRKELVAERVHLRKTFVSLALLFKDAAYRVIVNETHGIMGAGSFKEGAVVVTPNGMFKLVDRPAFTELNRFTHWAKYAIVGGRRPPRPSFLSRTKDWPVQKRLARLDQLLTRYKEKRYTLHYSGTMNGRNMMVSYAGEIHQRVLNMFADTRKRIEDGR